MIPASFPARVNDQRALYMLKLSFCERLYLLVTGQLWCVQTTFGEPIQPLFYTVHKEDAFTAWTIQ